MSHRREVVSTARANSSGTDEMEKCLIFKTQTCMLVGFFAYAHLYTHTHMILTIYNHIYQHSASESVCFSHSAIQVPLAGYPQYLLSGISFLLITVKLDQFSMSGLHSCPLK